MNKLLLSLTLTSALVLGSCSGGGGGGGASPSASTKLTISGTVDSQVTSANGTSSNPVKGATVNIVDASGNSQTVQTDSTGHYSAQVNKLTIYGVTVAMPTSSKPDDRGVSSPVYMKAVAQVGSNDFVLNVNPGSTAAVLVLQNKYSIKIGDTTSPIGTKLDNVDVDSTIANIYTASTFTNLAAAVAADVKNNTDPASDTNITNTLVPPVVTQVTPVPTSTAVCPSYQTMISGACVVTSCPAGQTLTNGACVTTTSSAPTPLVGTWILTSGHDTDASGNITEAGQTVVINGDGTMSSNWVGTSTAGSCYGTGLLSNLSYNAASGSVTGTLTKLTKNPSTCNDVLNQPSPFSANLNGTTMTTGSKSYAKQTATSNPLAGSWILKSGFDTDASGNVREAGQTLVYNSDGTGSSNWVGVDPGTSCYVAYVYWVISYDPTGGNLTGIFTKLSKNPSGCTDILNQPAMMGGGGQITNTTMTMGNKVWTKQ